MYELMTRQRVLSRSQYDVLYPFTGDMSKIDISLWLILARNVTPKSARKGINWSQSPERHETHWAHDLIRLREIRNFLFHVSAPELVGEKFAEIRAELVRVLRRLGTPDDVIEYQLNRDLDPQQTRISLHQIKEQYMEEQNALLFRSVQHKRHTRLLTAVVSVLAVLVFIGLTLVTSWYLSRRTPCSKFVQYIACGKCHLGAKGAFLHLCALSISAPAAKRNRCTSVLVLTCVHAHTRRAMGARTHVHYSIY